MPLSQQLAQPIKSLRRWLDLTAPSIQKSLQDLHSRPSNQNTIDKYFQHQKEHQHINTNEGSNSIEFFPWRDAPDLHSHDHVHSHHSRDGKPGKQPDVVKIPFPRVGNVDRTLNYNIYFICNKQIIPGSANTTVLERQCHNKKKRYWPSRVYIHSA